MTSSSNLPVKRVRDAKRNRSGSNFSLYLVGGALLLLILGVIALNIWNSRPASVATLTKPDVDPSWIDRTALGDPAAKVTVEAFEDLRCPHCREWTETVEPQLMAEYIKSGKVRFIFRQFPVLGPSSEIAAMAAECAADQGLFWQFQKLMFSSQQRGESAFEVGALVDAAVSLGATESEMKSCVNGLKHQKTVLDSKNRGSSLGLTSTPSIVINDQPLIVNGQSVNNYEAVKAAIDAALNS